MKIIIIILVIIILIITNIKWEECSYDLVTDIIDWDTFITKNNWYIRIIWIDAPELKKTNKPWKIYICWDKAKDYLSKLILQKKVKLCRDKLTKEKSWKRKLMHVFIDDKNIWLIMLLRWYAIVYEKENFKDKELYIKAQQISIKEKKWIRWECYLQNKESK